MKTKITTFIICLFASISLIGQTCVDVTFSTPAFGGDIELNPNAFIDDAVSGVTYTASPSIVGCDNIGTTTITISGSDGFSCTSELTIVDDTPPVAVVNQNIVISLAQTGSAQIFPETIDEGSYDHCSDVTLSLSQTEFDCDDLGEVDVVLTVTDASGNTNQAWTTITIEDKLAPQLSTNDFVNISFDQNGEISIINDMLLEGAGATDNCGVASITVSPSFFTCESAGLQNVIVTATDEFGNITAETVQVMLEDKLAPIPVVISPLIVELSHDNPDPENSVTVTAEDFDIGSYDNCGIVNMTINGSYFTCNDIGDHELTFTVYDAAGNSSSALTTLTVVDATTNATEMTCKDEVTFSALEELPFLVTAADLLEGGPYGCDFAFYLIVQDQNGDDIPNNLITAEHIGQTLTYDLLDWFSSDVCSGTIFITGEDPGCEFNGEDDITWPLELIELDLLNVDADQVTPEYIGDQADFTYADAYPTINAVDCNWIGIAYEDIVLPAGLFSYKILREFTVVDWPNYNAATGEGLYEFVQIIKNNNYPAWYICDVLPRSAPLGDCDSGHTLDDDVEWPNDITIADHRYTPSELVNYSGVALDDAEPQFSGEDAQFYDLTYDDGIGGISPEAITIERTWTVTHLDLTDLSFSYTQEIIISFIDFNNLVVVNTHSNRGVPEVELGNNIFTDQFGKAVVEDDLFINPEFSTEPLLGVDVVDLYLTRQYILGMIELNDYQQIAADVDENSEVSTLDLVRIQRAILGLEEDEVQWKFANITDEQIGISQVKGHYVAVKQGDVNDDVPLPGEASVNLESVDLTFEDQLLNNGETYTIPFYSDAMINASGIELRMTFDPAIIEDIEVTSEMFGVDNSWNADVTTGVLTILAMDINESHFLDGTTPVFEVIVKSKIDGVLNDGLKFSETERSFMIDEDLTKYRINGSLENEISVGTNDAELAEAISVYPNPAVDFINIDLNKTNFEGDYTVKLFDSYGRQITSQLNVEQVSTQNLPTGSYIVLLTSGDKYYSEVIQVIK